ncbi:MAG: hypothetical protein FP814_13990 [Desulfobacterium sp.]|nr:hypothetical protein [Desulfobacterium sp.]MBU3950409.1 hypothetical protein [Pseudomonadota bacterium]MBU4010230.1 hypothetical protein [Pseudomonadota bacterium]MBU4035355.1 hypothetical protein [Pseudomonadota bacterium]
MKKILLVISIMFVIGLVGCATTADIEKLKAQEMEINAKADQALQESQDAKAAAMKASDAAANAENALKLAEERAQKAEERAQKSEAMFEKSMKK